MRRIVTAAMTLALAGTVGCRIQSDQHGDGNDVKIATPFGGMQVKTNSTDVLSNIGLPAYPGAILIRKGNDNGKNDGAADINMSFGSFQLKVKAASYRTTDSPEAVLDFYRKALARFGTVIQCDDDKRPVGTPVRTTEGLTCSDDDRESGKSGSPSKHDAKYELKAGSRKHQHIVDINTEENGTRFGLVALDLPLDFHPGDKSGPDDKDEHKQ